ncbi:NAD(P)-dependent oxidoreductase [Cupriavidus taiwanensis]|uniref:NAD(P)-dependent oxidoreductase n=1 Tax=Cupriavidus taiwanensis TaxID=164546 RepID=UPI002795B7DF|nr:NAD(P)-dependent oxidoreductase [Cupriavidus taiwanensis]
MNLSRGSVVDEAALCHELKRGSLQGAALDVFEEEPLNDSPLRSLSNVVLSPHASRPVFRCFDLCLTSSMRCCKETLL